MLDRHDLMRKALVLLLLTPMARAAAGSETKLTASNGNMGDNFGASVSLFEDVIVVGAPQVDVNGGGFDQGSATVFRRNGFTWVEEQQLTDASGLSLDHFGLVSIWNDVIAVGINQGDVGANTDQGSVLVFRWNGTIWAEEQRLVESAGGPGDLFGSAVATGPGVIVVGSPYSNAGPVLAAGSVTVFRWSGAGWVEEQRLISSNAAGDDHFGTSVAIDGDVIAVGAADADAAFADQGSLTLFRWNGASWIEEQQCTSASGSSGDRLGTSVALKGNVVAAGAPFGRNASNIQTGAVALFRWDGSSWSEEQYIAKDSATANIFFGLGVALDDDVLAVGAPLDNSPGGSTTLFGWSGTTWIETGSVFAGDASSTDLFGESVVMEGGLLVSGAGAASNPPGSLQGAAYIHDLSPWTDVGSAHAGTMGDPVLTGTGLLAAGTLNGVLLSNALPNTTTTMVLGLSSLFVGFKGGTMVPGPPWLFLMGLPVDGNGQQSASFLLPPGIPAGTPFWVQHWFADSGAAGSSGFAASNGLMGVAP